MGEAILLLSPRKTRKQPKKTQSSPGVPGPQRQKGGGERERSCSMLACFCSDGRVEDLVEDKMDKVEFAFRKFDSDGDGFLSWEEFQQVKALHQIYHLENINLELFHFHFYHFIISVGEEPGPRASSAYIPLLQSGEICIRISDYSPTGKILHSNTDSQSLVNQLCVLCIQNIATYAWIGIIFLSDENQTTFSGFCLLSSFSRRAE